MFLTLMILGLTGLVVMALPVLGRHGHVHPTQIHPAHVHSTHVHPVHGHPTHAHGESVGDGHAGGRLLGTARANAAGAHAAGHQGAGGDLGVGRPSKDLLAVTPAIASRLRFIPSPRAIFSVLALYGAFGNALVQAAHLTIVIAALLALVPTLIVERLVVRPVWNLLFRFQGEPSSPMDELILAEARAVIPFRNGRGIVSTIRDGRVVQLAAQLIDDQAREPVKVGDLLRIEVVDARRERVTVSVLRD